MEADNVANAVTIVVVFNQMMINPGQNVDNTDISHKMLDDEMDTASGSKSVLI